ncbi:uncharacterized protein TM35_000981060, partial [Trypanosoma theileri]
TMAAAAAVDNDSPSGRGVSRGAVEVSCGAGGALRVRPAAASEWLTCGAGSRVSACGKYADLCRQRTARATTTIRTTTVNAGQPKAVMAFIDGFPYAVSWPSDKESSGGLKSEKLLVSTPGDAVPSKEGETVTEVHDRVDNEALSSRTLNDSAIRTVETPLQPTANHSKGGSDGQHGPKVVSEEEAEKDSKPPKSQYPSNLTRVQKIVGDVYPTVDEFPYVARTKDDIDKANAEEKSLTQKDTDEKALEKKQEKTVPVQSTVSSSENSASELHTNNLVEGNTTVTGTTTTQNQTQEPNKASEDNQPDSSNNGNNSTNHDHNSTQVPSPTDADATTTQNQNQESNTLPQEHQGTPKNTSDNTAAGDGNPNQQSSAAEGATATDGLQENANADSTATTTTTTTTTTTLSPVTDTKISSNIASALQNKGNVDSSVSPVWMRTAAPLLIVAVLVSVTVY